MGNMTATQHADTCFDCAKACEACVTACLEMGEKDSKGHDLTACIKLCRDCADICTLCARLECTGFVVYAVIYESMC